MTWKLMRTTIVTTTATIIIIIIVPNTIAKNTHTHTKPQSKEMNGILQWI